MINNVVNTNKVVNSSLWFNKSNPKEALVVLTRYPHKYDSNKAKVDVNISNGKTGWKDSFSQEHLLNNYKWML